MESVSERVNSIEMGDLAKSVRGSIQNASDKITSIWQDIQVGKLSPLYLTNS